MSSNVFSDEKNLIKREEIADIRIATQTQDDQNNLLMSNLRSVDEIPLPYRDVFSKYAYFNIVQSKVFFEVFNTDNALVVSAPTGSGKTAIFELAIIRLLLTLSGGLESQYKIVYVAPMKAICEERLADWHLKFAQFGVSSILVTGDSDDLDQNSLLVHKIIITTPEKWDSLTRKWRENQKLVKMIKLFMVDEVHILNDESRGPTLEAVISRMKTIESSLTSGEMPEKIRFIAISATIPNIEDISAWIGSPTNPAKYFLFGEDSRPVKLKKLVLGYPYNSQLSNPFKFDISLNYKLQDILMHHSKGKPTLIFCSTRKSVELSAKHVCQNLTINLNLEQRNILRDAAVAVSDQKLCECLVHGIGIHHAGVFMENRKVIEQLFRSGDLPVLITTSTLAMGVNLPAHLVIVKSTKFYDKGEYREYSESTILQMIGRAGRPQFDTTATAVIMTTASEKHRYENMVGGSHPVESSLHKHLIEHLNAEVVLHTITDLGVALHWLGSTFLYIRAQKNPKHYGLQVGLTLQQLNKKLIDMCHIEVNKLARAGMLSMDHEITIKPTHKGFLMAKYYLHFETMKLFNEVTGEEILQQLLALITKCHEFSDLYLRVNDKKTLNLLNKCRDKETIRFPLNGKIKTLDMKINCIIQAVLGCLPIVEPSLQMESQKIIRIAERVTKCLCEHLETKTKCFSARLNAILLAKCFHANLWENSAFVCKQLPRIGPVLSRHLVTAGKNNFAKLLISNPRDLERILNKKAPFGNDIIDQIKYIPRYEARLELQQENETTCVNLHIKLLNLNDLEATMTVDENSYMNLIVGDDDNNILLHEKYKHSFLKINDEMLHSLEINDSKIKEIRAYFISDDWVGIDCEAVLIVQEDCSQSSNNQEQQHESSAKNYNQKNAPKINTKQQEKILNTKKETQNKSPKCNKSHKSPYLQKYMDAYFTETKPGISKKTTKIAPVEVKPKKQVQQTIAEAFEKSKQDQKSTADVEDFFRNMEERVNSAILGEKQNALLSQHLKSNQAPNLTKKQIENRQKTDLLPIIDMTQKEYIRAIEFQNKVFSSIDNDISPDLTNTSLNQFKSTPRSKLDTASLSSPNFIPDSTTETQFKVIETLVPAQNTKTITWRSPLASFSYITTSQNSSNISRSPKPTTQEAAKPKKMPFQRMDSDDFRKNFPLSDEQCNQARGTSVLNKTTEVEDVMSSTFLQEMGLKSLLAQGKVTESKIENNKSKQTNKMIVDWNHAADYFTLLNSQKPTEKPKLLDASTNTPEPQSLKPPIVVEDKTAGVTSFPPRELDETKKKNEFGLGSESDEDIMASPAHCVEYQETARRLEAQKQPDFQDVSSYAPSDTITDHNRSFISDIPQRSWRQENDYCDESDVEGHFYNRYSSRVKNVQLPIRMNNNKKQKSQEAFAHPKLAIRISEQDIPMRRPLEEETFNPTHNSNYVNFDYPINYRQKFDANATKNFDAFNAPLKHRACSNSQAMAEDRLRFASQKHNIFPVEDSIFSTQENVKFAKRNSAENVSVYRNSSSPFPVHSRSNASPIDAFLNDPRISRRNLHLNSRNASQSQVFPGSTMNSQRYNEGSFSNSMDPNRSARVSIFDGPIEEADLSFEDEPFSKTRKMSSDAFQCGENRVRRNHNAGFAADNDEIFQWKLVRKSNVNSMYPGRRFSGEDLPNVRNDYIARLPHEAINEELYHYAPQRQGEFRNNQLYRKALETRPYTQPNPCLVTPISSNAYQTMQQPQEYFSDAQLNDEIIQDIRQTSRDQMAMNYVDARKHPNLRSVQKFVQRKRSFQAPGKENQNHGFLRSSSDAQHRNPNSLRTYTQMRRNANNLSFEEPSRVFQEKEYPRNNYGRDKVKSPEDKRYLFSRLFESIGDAEDVPTDWS